MRQRATAVDQPPCFPVFNTADNTLDGLDVSGVQGPSLQVIRNRQHLIRVGKFSLNLPNNRETNNLRLLRSKFFAFGNGDNDDILKLAEERFYLENLGTVLMAPISIDKLLILLSNGLFTENMWQLDYARG